MESDAVKTDNSNKNKVKPSKNQQSVLTKDMKKKTTTEEIKTNISVNDESIKTNDQKHLEDPFGGENLNSDVNVEKVHEEVEDTKDSPHFVEDDGEDLPDNFFDDFSNHDFMAGLDIVDDWIDEDIGESTEEVPEKSEENEKRSESSKHKKSPHRSNKDRSRYDNRSRRRHSREDDRYYRDHRRRSRSRIRRRSRSRHYDKNPIPSTTEKSSNDNLTKKDTSVNQGDRNSEEQGSEIDRRRDPEKTKRDIQRDKIRCAKDQEARVFQEQLKVAETGLVPPGTELDVVLKSDKFKEDEEKELKKVEVEKVAENKIESKEKDSKKEKLPEKRKVQEQHFRTKTNRKTRRSPERHPRQERGRSFSPKRRRRDSNSYDRERRNRSRHRDSRDVDLRYRIRQKRERYLNELSPVSDKRMSRSPSEFIISPESIMSDRETWIRHKKNRSFNSPNSKMRYSRSCSPISSNSLSDKDRLGSPRQRRSKKFSFMEEIEIKLRQNVPANIFPNPLPPNSFNMIPAPNMMGGPNLNANPHEYFPQPLMNIQFPHPPMFMGPAPTMCPPPDPFQHPLMMGSPDPNMVPHLMNLSNPPPLMPLHAQHAVPHMPQELSPFPVSQVPQVPNPPSVLIDANSKANNNNKGKTNKNKRQESNLKNCTSEEIKLTKLFEDKKISLSDFLSVSAKTIDPSTPVSIHNKIKVISRCQEAIKLLEDPKLTGRFFPKISHAIESEERINEKTSVNQSPMRRATVIRFNFTVPVGKRAANKLLKVPAPGVYLHKVLSILGLSKLVRVTAVSKPEEPPKVPLPVPKPVLPPSPAVLIKKKNAFIQTEPVKCQICEIRNSRKYSNTHAQTVATSTFDVSTQVSVEDLNKSCATFIPRGILKNNTAVQSISHLTPAQLLAQLDQEKKEEIGNKPWSITEKKETFPIGRGYADNLSGNFKQENNSRAMLGSSNNDNYKFTDSYRNLNPFSDNYTGSDNSNTSTGIFGNNSPFKSNISSQMGKLQGDRFGTSYSGINSGNLGMTSSYDNNRKEFMSNQNRGNFGPSLNDARKFDSPFNTVRRFPESNVNSNFGNWNSPIGRGNPRNLSSNVPNKFFNPRSN